MFMGTAVTLRPGSVGKTVEDLGIWEKLEKLLSGQRSLGCCGNLEDKAESGSDDGGLACEASGGSKDYVSGLFV